MKTLYVRKESKNEKHQNQKSIMIVIVIIVIVIVTVIVIVIVTHHRRHHHHHYLAQDPRTGRTPLPDQQQPLLPASSSRTRLDYVIAVVVSPSLPSNITARMELDNVKANIPDKEGILPDQLEGA
jgi:MFS superfamily sulfate permease-like transporter